MKILGHIKIFAAVIFALLTLSTPVAKNYHVVAHAEVDNLVTTSVEMSCPLCDFDFSVFDSSELLELPSVIIPKIVLYVPLTTENFLKAFENVFVIRGPPYNS
ncbi:MAG: hypothetical protein II937_16185 [Bacteroidales bacterium]|nr:hypothetical protein [Bacteroidales bacterium]